MLEYAKTPEEVVDIVKSVSFDKEELKNLIIKYPDTYIVNPLELEEKIKYSNNKKNTIIMYFQENSII